MRKIDLTTYSTGDSNTWDTRASLVAVLFNDKVDPREVLRRDELARRIEAAGDSILLEDSEHAKVVSGLNATDLTPFGRAVVEFVRRVLEAPVVDVQEKQ